MFNLYSVPTRRDALDHMMQGNVPVLTSIVQLVQDVELRPSSILFYPVVDTFGLAGSQKLSTRVVGSISIVFSWDSLLERILPDYIKGMICVLESSAGQSFTW